MDARNHSLVWCMMLPLLACYVVVVVKWMMDAWVVGGGVVLLWLACEALAAQRSGLANTGELLAHVKKQ